MTLRLLYNATSARLGGGLSYAVQQLTALAARNDLELTVLVSPWNCSAFEGVAASNPRIMVRRIKVVSAAQRFLWEQIVLPTVAKRYDALLCPGNFAPLRHPSDTPVVTILQNPNYVGVGRRAPQNRSPRRKLKILLSHLGMRASDLVVLISQSLAQEFHAEARLNCCSTVVIMSGSPMTSGSTPPDANPTQPPPPEPYFLSVANYYRHKHLEVIASGWATMRMRNRSGPGLIFVGTIPTKIRKQLLDQIPERERKDVTFLGPISDRSVITSLYQGALAAVAMSTLEAFPLTIHEAGSVGCPLILSDIPPHRELAGRNALYVSPGNTNSLARALESQPISAKGEPWTWDYQWSDHARDLAYWLKQTIDGKL